jgi:hypothetical protein
MLTWKLRITVLWIFLAICQAANMALLMLGPGVLHGLMAGQLWGANTHSAAVQINIAVLWLIPAAMAYLTLVLNAAASRWANAVVAAISALFALSTLISQPAGMSAGVNFVAIVGILVALLIIWHAWKGPREAEVTPVTPPRQSLETARR